MAYTINRENGSILASVADGTIDNSTDITLIGKNFAGYGEFLNENAVHMLENFSNSTAPGSPLSGQLWWDSANNIMQVYTGVVWKTISSSTAQASQPTNNVTGDLWWDTTNSQLKVYDGAAFVLIGPSFTSGTGQSGPIIDTITDTLAADHVVVQMYVNDVIVAIISKDPVFTPQVAITGFATVSPGYNLNSTIADAKWNGSSSDSAGLDGLASTQFLRSDANDSTSGTLSVLNDTGFILGADSDYKAEVVGSDTRITQQTSDGDIVFRLSPAGTPTTTMTLDATTNRVVVAGNPTVANEVANKAYVDSQVGGSGALLADGSIPLAGNQLPDGDGTRDLGSAIAQFANVYAVTFTGEATSAQYADVAERFMADTVYDPGTIVALGGSDEITRVNDELSETVFGVISEKPAHLMNAKLTGARALPVALTGRTGVTVIGEVRKGDRLVSAGNGHARAALPGEATSFNVVGRSLEDKYDDGVGTVEAFVSVN